MVKPTTNILCNFPNIFYSIFQLYFSSMPKYYCDYCDAFLTHDSPSVRKTHNGGRKHKENVRFYYQTWMENQAQKLIDATTKAFTTQRMITPSAMPPPTALGMAGVMPRPFLMPPMGLIRPPVLPTGPGFFAPPLPTGLPVAAPSAAMAIPIPTSAPAAASVSNPNENGAIRSNIKMESE